MPPAPATGTADRILDAADRLLGRFGYRKMTIEDLAREAGIGKGTVYLSFESKESIALACIDRMVDRLLARLGRIASGPGTPIERIRSLLLERVVVRLDYARFHSETLDELLAALRRRLMERRAGYFRREAEVIATVLAEGRRTGVFAIEDPLEIAHTLVLATNALLPYSLGPHEIERRQEIEQRVGEIADLLLHGITAPLRSDGPRRRTHS